MLYHTFETTRALFQPLRFSARMTQLLASHYQSLSSPSSELTHLDWLPGAQLWSAGCQLIDDATRRYTKPNWHITLDNGDQDAAVMLEREIIRKPFANLIRFETADDSGQQRDALPKVLLIAPLSGHYATLLRGTAQTLVQHFDVYVTDWADGRMVPLAAGGFDLSDYIDYLIEFIHSLSETAPAGRNVKRKRRPVHVVAVCQPTVPALAATAYMAMRDDPVQPATMTLMAGPVDTRINPTAVNTHATQHDMGWFKKQTISRVPIVYPGAMRRVYPGFLQLTGFMAMNVDRHGESYRDYFEHLAIGDDENAQRHREFYDEYMAVMDLPAEFFLQTVELVFQRHALATRSFYHRGTKIDCGAIRNTKILTVEAGRDDICGIGQTQAAHDLCTSLRDDQRDHYVEADVGHYGVFNGRRWRDNVEPRIRAMIQANDNLAGA